MCGAAPAIAEDFTGPEVGRLSRNMCASVAKDENLGPAVFSTKGVTCAFTPKLFSESLSEEADLDTQNRTSVS